MNPGWRMSKKSTFRTLGGQTTLCKKERVRAARGIELRTKRHLFEMIVKAGPLDDGLALEAGGESHFAPHVMSPLSSAPILAAFRPAPSLSRYRDLCLIGDGLSTGRGHDLADAG